MTSLKTAILAAIVSTAGLTVSISVAGAATVLPFNGVGQHATVMNNIYRSQQRNANAISHVQSDIRAAQRRRY